MTTEAQADANRRNAAKSTGPKSEAGKERARANAVKHGLAGRPSLAFAEDERDFAAFRMRMQRDYAPHGAAEEEAVDRIVYAAWCLRRAWRNEALTIDESSISRGWTRARPVIERELRPRPQEPEIRRQEATKVLKEMPRVEILEWAAEERTEPDDWPTKLDAVIRYQLHYERSYKRALALFERLRSLRSKAPLAPGAPQDGEGGENRKIDETNPISPREINDMAI